MESKQKQNVNNIADKLIAYLKLHDREKCGGEEEVWQRIVGEITFKENKKRTHKRIYRIYAITSVVAACLLVLLYIGKDKVFIDTQLNAGTSDIETYVGQLAEVTDIGGQIQLMLENNRVVQVDEDTIGIVYTSKGEIQINKDTTEVEEMEEDCEKIQFNQIIVPKGKYTQLMLADGTQMHINSGSRVVYPRVFKEDRREIYVDGEVFLDVTPDKKRPFYVKTSQFEVEVLGTSFNVNAYKKNRLGEVVLVEGSVKLCDKHNGEVFLSPNNLATVSEGQVGAVRRVIAADYTAWINGLLVLHTEPLKSVFEKLSRFYDVPIMVDPAVQTEMVEGKLDLHLPLPKLIQMISVIVPIEYQWNDGIYYITSKSD